MSIFFSLKLEIVNVVHLFKTVYYCLPAVFESECFLHI